MSKQFANRDVSDLVIEKLDGTPVTFIDYANVTAVDMTGEVVYAYGGQGHPKKVSFFGDRGGTLRIESQIADSDLYSLLTGAQVETSALFVAPTPHPATASTTSDHEDGSQASFSVPASCKEIIAVYPADKDLDLDARFLGTFTIADPGAGEDSTMVTFTADMAAGDDPEPITPMGTSGHTSIIVWYKESLDNVVKLNLSSTTFPKAVRIHGETWDKSTDDKIVREHMVAYKAVPQPSFTISNQNTGDPGTITITFDLFEDNDKNIFDLIFDDENENA